MKNEERQLELEFEIEKIEVQPEIKVIRNTYMCAAGLIKEEVTKKTWFIPVVTI